MKSRISTDPPKLLFWLLVAAASTFFAEVISGSTPFPFFIAWGLLVVLPLYGLHSLVLARIAFLKGAPRFQSLYFAGVIFGLYEAYITKVLWNPPWAGVTLHVLGVDWLSTFTLALWWHPFVSFIIPLMLVELFATSSSSIFDNLPQRLRDYLSNPGVVIGIAVVAGLVQTAAKPPAVSLLAGASGLLILWGLLAWWRKKGGMDYSLQELFPSGRSFGVLVGLLFLLYVLTGLGLRTEAYPGIEGHLVIWALYAAIGWLLWRSLQQPGLKSNSKKHIPDRQQITKILTIYLGTTFLGSFLPELARNLIFLAETIFGWGFGIAVLVYCLRQTLGKT